MIDPIQSLAFTMRSQPGAYAVLLGAGISRAAEIPTGGEVVLDLLGKLACLQGQSLASDKLVSWYCTQTGQEPSYTGLLEALAKTPVDRQRLLHSYWEATTAKEREEGRKQPTAAHCALAKLVPRGFVKVIITTNFDRLLEDALQQVGIKPTVLSAESQVRGAIPLTHMDCCIFKVNGDYQDYSSMRNTQKELPSTRVPSTNCWTVFSTSMV